MNRIEHREENWEFPFVEYSCNEKKDKLPLIIQLHGAGERGNGKEDLDFAAIAPVCGGGMAWNAEVLKMPIWAFHGAQDDVVSPSQSDEMVESLKACGSDVIYSRIDGVGHNVWDNTYDKDLIDWLLSKKRI